MSVDIREAGAEQERRSDLVKVGQGAVASLLSAALSTLSGLGVTILMTRSLGTRSYGAVALAVSIATLVQTFMSLGLSNGSARMMAFARAQGDEARMMRVLRSAIITGLATGTFGTLVVFAISLTGVFGGSEASTALLLISPLVVASGLRATLYGAIRAYRDLRAILVLGVIPPIIDVVAMAALVLAGVRSVAAFAGALTAVAYLDMAMVIWFVRRKGAVGRVTDTTWADTKALLAFSVPLVVTQLMYFAIRSTDVLLIGALRSTAEAGLYAPVMRLSEAASRALSAFPVLFVPVATAYVARRQHESLKEIYLSVTKWAYLLGFPVTLVLVVAPGQVLPALFGPEYTGLETLARILAIGYWVTIVTGLNGVTLGSLGAVRPMAVLSAAGMALSLGLGFSLIPTFGPIGAAWSNTVSYTAINVGYSWLLWRRTGITPFRGDTVLLFGWSLAVLAAASAAARLPSVDGSVAVAVSFAAILAWAAGAMLFRPFGVHWSQIRDLLPRRGTRRGGRREDPAMGPGSETGAGAVPGIDGS